MSTTVFPFDAIVGQRQLRDALLLCAVDPSIGGVLVRGDKGTAKSTAARALADVLPPIERTPGCAFNCAPGQPCAQCATCCDGGTPQPAAVPFVTLPLGATEDRVLGSLDIATALQGGRRAFQPGLLAGAHRGILYIDEVNLLADHLVDVLLDVATSGVNSVQRDGLALSHPARFTLVGTMNLEEGDLRPQLLDRFGLMVEVTAPRDKAERSEVVRRRIAFEADPAGFHATWHASQQALRERLATAQRLLPDVQLDDTMLDLISHLCCEFDVASLRADIVMHKAARAVAALDHRTRVTPDDLRRAAQLVLPHRRRRKPFEQPGLDQSRLDELLAPPPPPPPPPGEQAGDDDADQQHAPERHGGDDAGQVFAAAAAGAAPELRVEAAGGQGVSGRRNAAANAPRGQALRAVPDREATSIAIGATLRSAALRQPADADGTLHVTRADLHRPVRVGLSANLILFVVDASGSMAAQRRMEALKGAVLDLLTDAYQRRDEVAVVAFRGQGAELLLAPTRSVERAEAALRELPTGGRTPLPDALQLALDTLARATGMLPPLLVLLTDGRANVPVQAGGDPWRETLALAAQLAQRRVPALVIDTENGYLRLGRAAQLAQALGAECVALEQLSGDKLALTIRARLSAT